MHKIRKIIRRIDHYFWSNKNSTPQCQENVSQYKKVSTRCEKVNITVSLRKNN